MSNKCPLCNYGPSGLGLVNTPYKICFNCDLAYQENPPPKRFESTIEPKGNTMSDHDKAVNKNLAECLHVNHFKSKGVHLDIGSKYPVLGHYLQQLGHVSYAVDGIDEVIEYSKELGVIGIKADFEKRDEILCIPPVDFVTMVHVLEHFISPIIALKKVKSLLKPGGIVFIRTPNYKVKGAEREFTASQYEIHNTLFCERAIYELLKRVEGFTCYEYYSLEPGQCDVLLRKD